MNALRLIAVFMLAAAACSIDGREYGRQLLDDPGVSGADSNVFRCTTCHETGQATGQATGSTTSRILPGYTLVNVASRPTWWGGFETYLLDAVNQCVTHFMRGEPLEPSSDKARALIDYLQVLSPDATSPALPLTVVQNIQDLPSGDPVLGKQVYDDGCASCHGAPHTGAGQISNKATPMPDDSVCQHGLDPTTGARPIVIEKTRHGKFFNVGGDMAPYALEALSDEKLAALLGYLETFGLPRYGGQSPPSVTISCPK